KTLMQFESVENHNGIKRDIRDQVLQRRWINSFSLGRKRLALHQVSVNFADQCIVFILINAEKELAVVAGYVIVHHFSTSIKKGYLGVRQYTIARSICSVGDSLEVVVNHSQVGVLIDKRIDIVIAFASFSVRCKKAAISAKEEYPKVITLRIHWFAKVLHDVLTT